jgi:preprotein translocase YajC subunit
MSQLEVEILMTAGLILAIYWFFIRPRIEKGGRKKDMENLKIGDEVLTTSGFLGRVKEIYIPDQGPVQVVIDFGNGIVVNALSSAIAQRVAAGQTAHSKAAVGPEEKSNS